MMQDMVKWPSTKEVTAFSDYFYEVTRLCVDSEDHL